VKISADKTTLVLAGSFNPAILNPQWVGRFGLAYPSNHQFQVQVEIATPVAGTGGGIQKFSFGGISFAPAFQSLTFYCDAGNLESCQKAAGVASRVLRELPHTPIQGVGANFSFVVEDPVADALEFLRMNSAIALAVDEAAEVVSRTWSHSIRWGDSILTLQCHTAGNGTIDIECNVHYEVASAVKAAELLADDTFFQTCYGGALAAAIAFSGQELEPK
jgi:hypothetical protein